MNQDITVFPSRGQSHGVGGRAGLPASPEELWGGNGANGSSSTALGSPGGQAQMNTGLKKLHRMFRGRYLWGLGLALIGATAGGVLGWKSQLPQYQSAGLVEVRPVVLASATMEKVIPYYTQFVKGQASVIQDTRVIT